MRRFIVKKDTLIEYVEMKKSEKIYYEIIERLYNNSKYLNENISLKKTNQSVINDYARKNLISPMVNELLIKNNVINCDMKII